MKNLVNEAGPERITFPALAVLLLALALFFTDLGHTTLPSKDDAYHAQTAREMLERLDPIGISFGGNFTFQSSPLPNWLMAISYVAFGVNEYAARFPSAVLAFLGILFVYLFVRKRHGEFSGIAAAFILLTSFLYLRLGRDAMAEIPLTFFCFLALLAFIKAQEGEEKYYTWFGVATGLAILSKSALGVLPLMIAGFYFIATGRIRKLFSTGFIRGVVVAVVVAALWYVPVLLIHGQVFIDSHFGAYLGTHTFHGHHVNLGFLGVFFYLIWLPLHYLPWIIALVPSLIWSFRRWKDEVEIPILWLAVVVPVVVLSLITSKYTRYLTPIFPPAAMLIVLTWKTRLSSATQEKLVRGIAWLSVIVAIGVITLPIPLALDRNDAIREIATYVKSHAEPHRSIQNFGIDLWSYNAPLLFYGDHLLALPVENPEELFEDFDLGDRRFVLSSGTGSAAIHGAAPEGIDVEIAISAGDLVLSEISAPTAEDWTVELERFVQLINEVEPSRLLGSYRIPRSDLNSLMREEEGVKIMQAIDKPKRLFRTMERRGTSTGFAWRGTEQELIDVPHKTHEVKLLAYSEHLVLFTIERIAEDSEEDSDDDL